MNEYAEYFALIRENDFEGAKAYLAVNPAAANARDNTGVPAALRAMQTGDDDFCRWIIEQSLSKLNETDPDGATALHYAAAKGSPELLRYLVERVGWDPLRGDCKGRTPYGIAHAARNAAGEAYFAEASAQHGTICTPTPCCPGSARTRPLCAWARTTTWSTRPSHGSRPSPSATAATLSTGNPSVMC